MARHWILKTEPSTYSYADMERESRTRWDGVANALALKHLRTMRRGDRALIYHTGSEKAVVGVAKVVSQPYPDAESKDARVFVVDLVPERRLKRKVPLAAIRAEAIFRDHPLVRIPRLSVMPATAAQWRKLVAMGGK